uniref:Epidermal patterning factor-like protein n=1 Tax=Rodentolepis nana TaxID=102285 RepID=A0A0R3TFV5_RODNA
MGVRGSRIGVGLGVPAPVLPSLMRLPERSRRPTFIRKTCTFLNCECNSISTSFAVASQIMPVSPFSVPAMIRALFPIRDLSTYHHHHDDFQSCLGHLDDFRQDVEWPVDLQKKLKHHRCFSHCSCCHLQRVPPVSILQPSYQSSLGRCGSTQIPSCGRCSESHPLYRCRACPRNALYPSPIHRK